MKTLVTLIFLCALCMNLTAQFQRKMSYQAVIRDTGGKLVINQTVGMRITIMAGSFPPMTVYQETQTPTTNANGLVTIEIGGGSGFDAINWGGGEYFIITETDPGGGTNYTISATSQLLSVPYSFHAKTAETAKDPEAQQYAIGLHNEIENLKKEIENLKQNLGIGTVSDIEGNVYRTIRIGTQVWMAENLRTTTYKDGTAIPQVTDKTAWANLATPGYCWYNNDKATYGNIYGALYNWHTLNTGRLCPQGWHGPMDAEWTTLTTFLGGEAVAGGKMKETGTAHWQSPNTGATNESGFSALPGGTRYGDGEFGDFGGGGYWWSSENSTSSAWIRYLVYGSPDVTRGYYSKDYGFSVRCLRD